MKRPARVQAEILSTHTPELFEYALQRAVERLRAGELVGVPTETVYGLAANALDARAVARIFAVKGRPANNPIIVHVASVEMAKQCVNDWPVQAGQLAAAYWPGPLTIVLPRSSIIPDNVAAGGSTVGVRWPDHPFIQGVIKACGFPLAAPSANLSTQLSPTSAEHVARSLSHKISLIIDGGPTNVGLESTVIDLTESTPRLLRPGMIQTEALAALLGKVEVMDAKAPESKKVLRSPGLLKKHYAPQARLVIGQWLDTRGFQSLMAGLNLDLRLVHVVAHTHVPQLPELGRIGVLPREPEAFARGLYAALHDCDAAGAQLIVVEALPPTPAWRAIQDRLQRAAAV